ncbi:MAG: hypothetical protein FWG97_00820 [Deltaproteobacteria bacterium]|nr:hypothetical protein [Deltaproteobacteria bacterium]
MTGHPPQVAIMMATCNGAEFLPEQLDSLAGQTYDNWRHLGWHVNSSFKCSTGRSFVESLLRFDRGQGM